MEAHRKFATHSATKRTSREQENAEALLHDGPIVNVTILAIMIISHELVHLSTVSLFWKTGP